MLVKRIAEHIRRQDWTAVAIEFLIVVIGIYAAFELDRWRDLEAERRANKNFIRMLSLELEEKLPEAGNRIDSYRELQDEQDSVIAWLNGDKPASAGTGLDTRTGRWGLQPLRAPDRESIRSLSGAAATSRHLCRTISRRSRL